MPRVCQLCQAHFPVRAVIDGKRRVLANRKYCLTCSPFGKHNTRPIDPKALEGEKRCSCCKQVKSSTEFHRNGTRLTIFCKSCLSRKAIAKQRENKQRAVDYKGGKCFLCGYSRCLAALEFHHLDPAQKEFSIAKFRMHTFATIRDELDKCVLLCCRCHREVEAGITELDARGETRTPNQEIMSFLL